MKKSNFQFTDPALINFEFRLNQDFDAESNKEVMINTKFNVNVQKNKELNEAIVELNVIIDSDENSFPFFINATEGAQFHWEEDDGRIDSFLNINAPSLLLGYLRPIIASITAASPYNAYNIPFMNFVDTK